MIADAEKYAEEDRQYKEKSEARHALSNYIDSMTKSIGGSLADRLEDSDKTAIEAALTEAFDWIKSNEDTASKDGFEEKMNEL